MAAEGVRYLSVAEVLVLHTATMEGMGLAPAPVRDEGALESAVLKPQMAAYYEQADLIRQTVFLAVGISQAQAFIDGNKRTAFVASLVFLRVNRHPFNGDRLEFAQHLEAVAERTDSLDSAVTRFEEWLRQHVD